LQQKEQLTLSLTSPSRDDKYGKNAQFASDHQYNHYKRLLDVRLAIHQALPGPPPHLLQHVE
jgi:hypothetical protein